jgi:septation ring formation regulator EzrA
LTSSTKITLAVIIVVLVLITFVFLYFTDQHIKAVEGRHEEILKISVNEAATSIEHFIQSRQKLIETFAFEKQHIPSQFARNIENQT